jgi:uncharacterized membrane protein
MINSELVLDAEVRALMLHSLHWIATVIEIMGVAVIILGVILATAWAVRPVYAGDWNGAFRAYRANLGGGILLGLEFLIAADIVGMVAIVPTFERLGILALIIVIRTFLSFSLQIEIEGRWPWRRYNTGPGETRADDS